MKKIVILGPESTGKSTLCQQLATNYNTLWVPEYARQYLTTHGKNYTYDDLLIVAQGQAQLEDEYSSLLINKEQPHSPFLFVDTNMYVMKVWCEFVFGNCHPWILNEIGKRKYDLYLLCNIDLPWTKDELREYPDLLTRERLYGIYKNIMVNQPVPWVDIAGTDGERLQKAIEGIQQYLP